jgi:radical SAM superfamily enzyme YgiQ (UPF0313 family)
MRVLLVYPNIGTGNGPHFHHGIGSLVAVLKEAGHAASLLCVDDLPADEAFLDDVRRDQPGLVGFAFGSHQWRHVRRLSSLVKDRLGLPTLAGGVHATHAPDETLAHPGIDMICRGEGEGALVDLARALEAGDAIDGIANLWVKTGREIVRNDLRPLIADLDALPFADREAFPMGNILATNAYEMPLMAGRGCPYGCTYCCNHALAALYKGKGSYVRFRSVKDLLIEIDHLASRYRIDTLYFEDDIFTLRREWAEEFAREYKRAFAFPFRIYVHVEAVERDLLALLRDAGLAMVNVGVESGNEAIRREVMNRRMTNARIQDVFEWLRDLDIVVRDFNIVGLPGETPETMRDTLRLNECLQPDQIQVSIFYPYPGTKLHEECRAKGYLSGEERQTYFEEDSVLDLPDLTREEIRAAYVEFCDRAREIERQRFLSDLERGRAGYHDFLAGFADAVLVYGQADRVRIDRFLIGGRRRFVLFEHPRARLDFAGVEIRPGARLRFAMALDPKCLEWGGTGIVFRVRVADDGHETEVFAERIDPKGDPAQRVWHDREVDLSAYAGRRVTIGFLTDPDESGDLTGAWAGWARPHLIAD